MPLTSLRSGYNQRYHGLFSKALDELHAEGLVDRMKKRTGRDSDFHFAVVKERLPEARALINAYRRNVGLIPYRPDLMDIF